MLAQFVLYRIHYCIRVSPVVIHHIEICLYVLYICFTLCTNTSVASKCISQHIMTHFILHGIHYCITTFKYNSIYFVHCSNSVAKSISQHIVTQFASPSAIVNPQGGSLPELSKSGPHNHIEEWIFAQSNWGMNIHNYIRITLVPWFQEWSAHSYLDMNIFTTTNL